MLTARVVQGDRGRFYVEPAPEGSLGWSEPIVVHVTVVGDCASAITAALTRTQVERLATALATALEEGGVERKP